MVSPQQEALLCHQQFPTLAALAAGTCHQEAYAQAGSDPTAQEASVPAGHWPMAPP